MQQPENSKPFPCPKGCGRRDTRQEHLNRHTQKPCKPKEPNRHVRDRLTRYTKPLIHIAANDGQVHDVHHDGNGRFPCVYGCERGFSTSDHLRRHMKICRKSIPSEEGGTAQALSDSVGLNAAETANRGGEPLNGDQPQQAGEHNGIRRIPAGEYTQACIPF